MNRLRLIRHMRFRIVFTAQMRKIQACGKPMENMEKCRSDLLDNSRTQGMRRMRRMRGMRFVAFLKKSSAKNFPQLGARVR